jgi:hypothetical protein
MLDTTKNDLLLGDGGSYGFTNIEWDSKSILRILDGMNDVE